jgi:hypothetical protein
MGETDRIEHLFRFADACWRDYYWTEADSVLGTTPPHSRKLLG